MVSKSSGYRSKETLPSWLRRNGYKLPIKRPWYLTPTDTEEVMGYVWLNIVRGGHLHEGNSVGYLITAVKNEIRRQRLAQKFEQERTVSIHELIEEPTASTEFEEALQRRNKRQALLRHLDERHRHALELKLDGYTCDEVSDILRKRHGWDVAPDTVRKWYERDVRRLRMLHEAQAA